MSVGERNAHARARQRERERARARDLESQSGVALENDFSEVRRRCTCDVSSFVSLAFDKLLTHFGSTSAVVRGVLALRAALCSTCQRAPDFISVITPFFYYLSISYGGQGYLAVNSHRCNYTGHLSLVYPIPRSQENANARSKGWFMREEEIWRYACSEMSYHKISIAGEHMRKRSMHPKSVGGTRGWELMQGWR